MSGALALPEMPRCHVIAEETDECLHLRFLGDLDIQCDRLRPEVLPLVRGHRAGDIVIDCSGMTFVDLRGLDFLLEISLVAKSGGQVALLGAGGALMKLVAFVKAESVFVMQLD